MPSSNEKTLYQHFDVQGDVKENSDGTFSVIGHAASWGDPVDKLPVSFREVTGSFDIRYKLLPGSTLEGCPRRVGGLFDIRECNVKSLAGLPDSARCMFFTYFPNLGLLPILNCHSDFVMYATNHHGAGAGPNYTIASYLLSRYAGSSAIATLAFASELIANGLESNAKF